MFRIFFSFFILTGMLLANGMESLQAAENADIVVTPYPSDHRAVVATFTLCNNSLPNP